MTEIAQSGIDHNSSHIPAKKNSRRDAPVICASCGRQVERRGRLQLYCSTRCRKRGHYAQSVRRGDISPAVRADTAIGTTPLKKENKFKALQRAKSLSSHRILAPERVLAVEVFDRAWQHATSSDGVAIQMSRIRPRALLENTDAATIAARALGATLPGRQIRHPVRRIR
jgi:hypothetical protein